jgi:hypothetical protein
MERYIEKTRKKGVHKIGNVYVNIGKLVKDFNRIHTKVNKIKVGGFSCIYNNLFKEDTCRNIQDIRAFKENIPKILNKTLDSEELLCSLMIWFLREHMPTETEQIYKLLGNSANAKYTRVITSNKPYNQTDPEKISYLIFKFQIKDESDDLVIDILNTRLINKLFIGEEKSSFMVYTEFFMTYIDEPNNTFNLDKYQQKFKGLDQTPPSLLAVKCMVVENITYNRVHENVSLKSLFKIITSYTALDKLKIFQILNLQLNIFFKHLKIVGESYGFVHNDCHLGNIFINSENQLVLIDMGRVYFNFNANILSTLLKRQRNADKPDPKKVLEIYKSLIEEENQKFIEPDQEPYKYDTIIQKIKQKNSNKKPIYINPFYRIEDIGRFPVGKEKEDFQHVYDYYVKNMYLFDISTIILNVLHYTTIDKECETFQLNGQEYNFREEVLRIFDKEHEDSENASLINNFVISKDKGLVKIELAIFKESDNLLSSKFNLGIYIFGIFVLYIMKLFPEYYTEIEENETKDPKDISEDTIVLKRNVNNSYTLEIYYRNFVEETYCMWHSYQYINIPKIYMFYGYFHKHKDMIEKLKPPELKPGQQGGRKVCPKMPKIPEMPTSYNLDKTKDLYEIIDNTFLNNLNNILGYNKLQDEDFKYKNDTIPNNVPEKAHRFYEPESPESPESQEIDYSKSTDKTLYSEIEELFNKRQNLDNFTEIIKYIKYKKKMKTNPKFS